MEKWMKNFLILLTIDSKQLNLEVLFYSLLILLVELCRLRAVSRKNAKQHEHVSVAYEATSCHLFCILTHGFSSVRETARCLVELLLIPYC